MGARSGPRSVSPVTLRRVAQATEAADQMGHAGRQAEGREGLRRMLPCSEAKEDGV